MKPLAQKRVRRGFTPLEQALLLTPILLMLLTALGWAYHERPYQDVVARFTTSLAGRTPAQRHNIALAASHLDGTVVAAGGRFSFNEVVGPRTPERGYAEAIAFMEGERTTSVGGGVCQLSSTLYAALQETTLRVLSRVPHAFAVSSVPPGRDATVWYGQADLVFENPFAHPIRLAARVEGNALKVAVWGTAEEGQHASLRFSYRYGHHQTEREVWVYRRVAGRNVLLSKDTYKLTRR